MPDKLLGRIGDFLQGRSPWYKLPRLLAMPRLVEIRNQLRKENLHDTEEPPLEKKPVPANLDPKLRNALLKLMDMAVGIRGILPGRVGDF